MNKKNIVSAVIILLLMNLSVLAKDVYVDAKKGDDANKGDIRHPFQTLKKATSIMTPGDICYIKAGVYRETLVPEADQLTFRSYENDYVLVSGLDVVKAWTPYKGNVWKAEFKRPVPPGNFKASMLFMNGKRMNRAHS